MLHLSEETARIVTDRDNCSILLMDAEPVSLYKGRGSHFFSPPNCGQGALAIVESQLIGA